MGKVLLKNEADARRTIADRHAFSMDPNNYIAHNLLGQAYRMQGLTSEADNEFQLSQKLQAQQGHSQPELQSLN